MIRQPAPESFICPRCNEEVEIWTDELKRDCPNCGSTVMRDTSLSCLAWCAKAAECVGEQAYADFLKNRITSIRHRLLDGIRNLPADGERYARIAEATAERSAEIAKRRAVDWHIVLPASLLFGIDHEDARRMLFAEGLPIEEINEILSIIDGNPDGRGTPNFDAVHLAAEERLHGETV